MMHDRHDPILPAMMTTEQAAEALGLEPGTLVTWRCTRRYDLPYVKVGRAIRYRRGDVLAWIERNTVGGATE